jgi:type IV pilus assembly protein PilV
VSQSDYTARRGFTLVEVLIAMLVLLLGMLSSLVGVIAAGDYNLGNALRNEAVKIAQEQLENTRVGRYDAIASTSFQVQRQVRKTPQNFQVTINPTTNDTLRQVNVIIQWTFKNRPHSYTAETIVRQRVTS